MIDNPVVEEVRQARKEILEHYHGDVRAMLRGMIQKQRESGLAIVEDVPKTSRPLAAHEDPYPYGKQEHKGY